MTFEWQVLIVITVGYLGLLFFAATFAETGKLGKRIVGHPLTYVLAFGVSCTSWAFYGSVGLAYQLQHGYLSFYIGLSVLLVFSAILIRPLFNLATTHQLSSLPDLFAFRYRSKWVGFITAISVLLAVLPLLSMQIQSITDVIKVIDPSSKNPVIAAVVSLMLLYITIIFGTRRVKPSETHHGLILALAIESLFKLIAFLTIGWFALFEIGGGFSELQTWLSESPVGMATIASPVQPAQWFSLLLLFSSAPLVLPHLFQILFRENSQPGRLRIITWAAPLYLLLMALPVMPILWAGVKSGSALNPEYFTLSIALALDSTGLTILTYLGGLAASCGITIIAVLALSSMLLNHVVMPFTRPDTSSNVYDWLLWTRRAMIFSVFGAVYAFYVFLNQTQSLSTLLITSYTGLVQMMPGLMGLLFWRSANRNGFLAGLFVGMSSWLFMQFFPLVYESLSFAERLPLPFSPNENEWSELIFLSLGLNIVTFILVSITTPTKRDELEAAETCAVTSVKRRKRIPLKAKNAREFIESLTKPLGQVMAEREVLNALEHLNFELTEYRPYALRRLRDMIEANLSGIMGPSVATAIISRYLPYEQADARVTEDIQFLENNLDSYHHQLSGMSAELDRLRRHHRETLYRLPIGVCSLTNDGEIILWNEVMAKLTGVSEEQALGAKIELLPATWFELINTFLDGELEKITTEQPDASNPRKSRWFSLHRTQLSAGERNLNEGTVILLEDETDNKLLENELVHSERLAAIGGLAAGIAHEIGNPITGIDCLAQDLKYAESSEEISEISQQIRHEADRVTKIVRAMVNFSHAGENSAHNAHTPHHLRLIVQDAIDLLSLARDEKQIIFVNTVDESIQILCEPQRLAQVFTNLLGNARDASERFGQVNIEANVTDKQETVTITVTDQGSGIKKSDLDHIFDPFFTTKEVGRGTGLGLFLSYSIIEEHFGHISAHSPADDERGIGTEFTIKLPLHTDVTLGNEGTSKIEPLPNTE